MNSLLVYYKYQKEIKTGDHLGFRGKGVIGWLIRKFSKGEINHSAIALRLRYGGLDKRRFTVEALDHGIEFHMLSRRLQNYQGEVWWYPLKEEYDEVRYLVAEWMLDNVDVPYDYRSLFKQAVSKVSSDANKLFCSESCNFAWVNAGIDTGWPLCDKAPTPADIDKFDIFKDKIRIL